MAAPGAAVHPLVEPLRALLGVWRGEGEGTFPTITAFKYGEEITFVHAHASKPVIAYAHKTFRLADKAPMHAESGFLRPKADGSVACVIAQATGMAENSQGTFAGGVLSLRSTAIGGAEKVLEVAREYTLSEDGELSTLRYEISMRTTTQPLQPHLRATLRRVAST
jgi:hypothetical protein